MNKEKIITDLKKLGQQAQSLRSQSFCCMMEQSDKDTFEDFKVVELLTIAIEKIVDSSILVLSADRKEEK